MFDDQSTRCPLVAVHLAATESQGMSTLATHRRANFGDG